MKGSCPYCRKIINYSDPHNIICPFCGASLHNSSAANVLAKYNKTLMNLPGVISVYPKGDRIVVLVTDADSASSVQSSIDGIPVEIKITGEIGFQPILVEVNGNTQMRTRPVVGGVSIGPVFSGTGTLGGLVYYKDQAYMLSNNHVFAGMNTIPVGEEIIQPGYAGEFGMPPEDTVGHLAGYIPYRKTNIVDMALALPVSPDMVSPEILGIGIPTSITHAAEGMRVKKVGRTTGYTEGVISSIDATIEIRAGDLGAIRFQQQLVIESEERFADAGDSGSAILDMDNNWVGLLFAGDTEGHFTIANKMPLVQANIKACFEKKQQGFSPWWMLGLTGVVLWQPWKKL